MSSRALKRLQEQKAVESLKQGVQVNEVLNDDEEENVEDDAMTMKQAGKKNKKKKGRTNLFHLLADEEEEEKGENEENEEDIIQSDNEQSGKGQESKVTTSSVRKKTKKKKNKKKKKEEVDDEVLDNLELDEIDRANLMLGLTPQAVASDSTDTRKPGQPFRNKSLLSVDYRNFNPTNEMKRRFGSAVVEPERRRNPHERKFKRTTRLVTPKDTWPPYTKVGIIMTKEDSDPSNVGSVSTSFTFEHQEAYQKLQHKFYDAVESMDHNNIVALLNGYPYHIDSLLQLSEVCRHNEDVQMASELIERALYVFECNFHTLFNIALGTCRVNYKRSESRPFFLALFRHIKYIGDRACYRTALEFCKLLLGLDPDEDPLCVLLILDYYAIKAEEYEYLIELYHEYEVIKNVSLLPNFAFSYALANFHLGKMSEANKAIRTGLIRFPSVFVELMDKCGVSLDDTLRENPLYNPVSYLKQSSALNTLIALYVGRSFSLWKLPEVIDWVVGASKELIDEVDGHTRTIEQEKQMRETRYNRIPTNILRHVIISEIKEALRHIPLDVRNKTILTYDPLPPEDSITGYVRPRGSSDNQEQRNLLTLFFESMLPSFDQAENERARRAEQNEARALRGEHDDGNVLRNGAEGLMNAMRELLHTMTFRDDGQGANEDEHFNEEEWE